MARQPTMMDVARAAGVSTAAVSYHLSGRAELVKRVGPEARNRIEHAIANLGYVQNKTARHLRRQRTERICVLLPELGNPFADKIARDVDNVAQSRGYTTVVTIGADFDARRQILREVEAGLTDAVVASVDGCSTAEINDLFAPLVRANRPCLVIHPTADPKGISVVNHDRVGGLRAALAHVLDRQHHTIAYCANGDGTLSDPRMALVRTFATAHRDRVAEPILFGGAESRPGAVEVARRLVAMSPRPTVVLSESDFSAVAMINEFQRSGLRVPDDIAVIGCGNAEEGVFCAPRLTTIGPTEVSLTRETRYLIDVVEERVEERWRRFVVPWQLYVRESG
ncbi:LacI family DNA-binding transcriptional regulator [Bauldia sp.]|uniref:LacI family DNA-binding transcriptional regulator n=1 Tax=Bauldia sp. TaxID=2575872 RepID=UPI003BAB7877